MKYVICKHGDRSPGYTTVTFQRGDQTLIIENVPAEVCDNCGEHYLSDDAATRLHQQAEVISASGFESPWQ